MTWLEVHGLISEIPKVSTTFLLKEYVGSFLFEKYDSGAEFEEYDSEEDKKQAEFERLQHECIEKGIRPPLKSGE